MTAISALRSCSTRARSVTAEDGAADDLEGERAHALAQHEPLAGAPAGDLALGDLADDLAEGAHVRALKRRQQQTALAQVLRPVQHQHRVGTQHWLHDRVRLAARRSDWSPLNSSRMTRGSATYTPRRSP